LSDGESVVTNGAFKVDAAAQIAGKQSMMNRDGSNPAPVHNHGGMPGNSDEMSMNDDNSSISKAEFNVAGNCVMCKNRIEAAATSIAGVTHASWDETSKLIQLHFDPDQTSDAFISEAIASVGHDTELHKANDAVYDSLPGCCKYDRLN
jgi:Cu(I)/Ag(I) efflux system membrane fusion protein